MRKTVLYSVLLAITVTLLGADVPRTREFEFTYGAHIGEIPKEARRVDVWLPYPTSDEHQEISVTEISIPAHHQILKDPEYGNSILHFSIANPAERNISIKMKVNVRRQEYARRDLAKTRSQKSASPSARWSKPDRLVPLDDRIKQLARDVTKGKTTDLEKARAIYDYVVDTMSYDKSGSGWGTGNIYWACDTKRGNCTDFHALFIGLNRAVGIPSRFAIGFPIPNVRGQGKVTGYHCWAEFHVKGYGWIPVDASEAWKHPEKRDYYFGAHDENRVQFSLGRDIVLNPRQSGDPLNYFIYPYVEVDAKRFEGVSMRYSYKDRGEPGTR